MGNSRRACRSMGSTSSAAMLTGCNPQHMSPPLSQPALTMANAVMECSWGRSCDYHVLRHPSLGRRVRAVGNHVKREGMDRRDNPQRSRAQCRGQLWAVGLVGRRQDVQGRRTGQQDCSTRSFLGEGGGKRVSGGEDDQSDRRAKFHFLNCQAPQCRSAGLKLFYKGEVFASPTPQHYDKHELK